MNAALMGIVLALASASAAAMEATECEKVGKQFYLTPYSLTIGQYDALENCAADLKAAKIREGEKAREDRAIKNNFGRKLEDAE